LFSVAPAKPVASPGKPYRDNAASHLRHLLPKDLAGALRHLEDAEIDALLVAVTTEAERRGRFRQNQKKKPRARREIGSRLTSGQQNAVRAAFKAGVKPSAIARQFRISHSEVRKALAKEEQKSKSR